MMKLIALLACLLWTASGFHMSPMATRTTVRMLAGEDDALPFFADIQDDAPPKATPAATPAAPKKSLDAKMAGWDSKEASTKDDAPKEKERTGGFDAGLYVAFPFMIAGGLLFAFFPFIMEHIDVSSVGPPPGLDSLAAPVTDAVDAVTPPAM